MGKFIGRKPELKVLRDLLRKNTSSFVVIKGRRRIGKSRLIKEFTRNHQTILITGFPPSKKTTALSQKEEFKRQLLKQARLHEPSIDSWANLFMALGEATKQGRYVIVLDEISWLGSKDPDFLGHLKTAWDLYFSPNPELILVVCGSVSSWINRNILSSTGFVGRISVRMDIKELPVHDCAQFWNDQIGRIDPYEIFKALCVTGGIPRYLEEIITTDSAEENIQKLCFSPSGLLFNEFDSVFNDIFSEKSAICREILKHLAEGSLLLTDIYKTLGVTPNSYYIHCVDELEQAGFVSRDYTWNIKTGKVSNLSRIRLSDNYVRFYLKLILPKKKQIEKSSYSAKNTVFTDSFRSMLGLQFENLVLNNFGAICKNLNLPLSDIQMVGPYFQKPTARKKGCQIDILVQTYDQVLYLIEIKFSKKAIGEKVKQEVKEKISNLTIPRGFSIKPILIHVNGVSSNLYNDRFFSRILDFTDLITERRHL